MSGIYRSASLKAVSQDFAKYKLDLVGVQEVRWDKDCAEPADDYTFLCVNGNANHHVGAGFVIHKGIHHITS
jgi:hypothetical protein